MAKNIVSRVDRNLARRLREARREVGLSTRAVAARLPRKLAVSHVTIASYENGTTVPPVNVLAALAEVYQRPLNWFLENRQSLECFRYRNLKSRVRLADRRQFEALAGKWAEAYMRLERKLKTLQRHAPNVVPLGEDLGAEEMAKRVRHHFLQLDDNQPVENVIQALELFSTWALEIRADFGVDGVAARLGEEYIVVLNPLVANERMRMNAAIELAYVLYDGCREEFGWSDNVVEGKAYLFASSFLLPDTQLKAAFQGKSFLRLVQYKEKFGISLAAMIHMAEKAGVINTTASRWLWGEMARRGWRQHEPGYVWRDRAITFEMMLESAIQTKTLSWTEAERVTGVREVDLRHRLENVLRIGEETAESEEAQPTLQFGPRENGGAGPREQG